LGSMALLGNGLSSVRVSDASVVERLKDYSLNTIPNMVTTVLEDLRDHYVIGDGVKEVKMRTRIAKIIEIVNGESRMAGMVIKDRKKSVLGSSLRQMRNPDQVENIGKDSLK